MTGIFILLVGPAGSGKSVIGDHVRSVYPDFVYPRSCTTRASRPNDTFHSNRVFLEVEDFKQMIKEGEFLEWAMYAGNYYGTRAKDVLAPLKEGKIVFKEVEAQGAAILQESVPKENLRVIFIDAGTWEDLEKRVVNRAPISDEELKGRMDRYKEEMKFASQADYILHNVDGRLEETKKKARDIIEEIIQGR